MKFEENKSLYISLILSITFLILSRIVDFFIILSFLAFAYFAFIIFADKYKKYNLAKIEKDKIINNIYFSKVNSEEDLKIKIEQIKAEKKKFNKKNLGTKFQFIFYFVTGLSFLYVSINIIIEIIK